MFRIYNPSGSWPATPTSFRHFGPKLRFDHQPRKNGKPQDHPQRAIWYGAYTPAACLVEVFGDKREIRLDPFFATIVECKRDLRLLDLDNGAMWNGTYAAIGSVRSRRITQRWSTYFYGKQTVYNSIDGLYYKSAHNGGACVALFERCSATLTAVDFFPLRDQKFAYEIADAQQRYGMTVFTP